MGLRERNRRAAMHATQRTALRLFRERGFAAITVEEIAAEAGMAASTVFRHFGTKEAVVIWDEHDAALDNALARRLARQPPFEAMRDAFVETLAQRYEADLAFELDRVQFIYQTEALHAAAVEAQFADRDELTAALADLLSPADRHTAPLMAGAALLALDVAIDQWQQRDGKEPLGDLIHGAFETLQRLNTVR
ncbi:MAG: helix-turn-helix domain-containing protein [Ornithinimicrobium sp.]